MPVVFTHGTHGEVGYNFYGCKLVNWKNDHLSLVKAHKSQSLYQISVYNDVVHSVMHVTFGEVCYNSYIMLYCVIMIHYHIKLYFVCGTKQGSFSEEEAMYLV